MVAFATFVGLEAMCPVNRDGYPHGCTAGGIIDAFPFASSTIAVSESKVRCDASFCWGSWWGARGFGKTVDRNKTT